MFNNKENKDVFLYALHKWGFEAQRGMLQEECIEYVNAQAKFELQQTPQNFKEWLGELADVMVMVDQMKLTDLGKRIKEAKTNFKTLNVYGILENRHKMNFLTSAIALNVRKYERNRLLGEVTLDLVNNLGALDVVLDSLKNGDACGIYAETDAVQNIYQFKVKRLWERLQKNQF